MLSFVSVVFAITLVKYCLCTVEIRTGTFMLGGNRTATSQIADVFECGKLCNLENDCSGFTVTWNGICELTFNNDNVYLCSLESKLCYYKVNFIQVRTRANMSGFTMFNVLRWIFAPLNFYKLLILL